MYFALLLLKGVIEKIIAKAVEIQVIGFNISAITFDWFFINTQSVIFLVLALAVLTLSLIIIGKKMASDKSIWSFDSLLMLLLYGFIAPVWIARALIGVIFSKETSWK